MKKEYLKYLFLIIFGLITLYFAFNRVPCPDEAHSWLISRSFDLPELFRIEKYDGHLFIWHLIQMPFSKNDFLYPYSILFLNWFFCVSALFVMWRFSPFKTAVNALITFSLPFVWYFAPVARCYSIGILFLFIILALWKKRLEHPFVIPFLLIGMANTSAVAVMGAFPLGLIYIFDLIKNKNIFKKKDLIISFAIFCLGVFLVYLQLWGGGFPEINSKRDIGFLQIFHKFIFYVPQKTFYTQSLDRVFRFVVCVLYLISIPYFYKKSKSAFFFLISSFALLFALFVFVYQGYWWHYYFFYIYFIASFWISEIQGGIVNLNLNLAFKTAFLIVLSLFSVQSLNYKNARPGFLYMANAKAISRAIMENKLFDGADKIYTLEHYTNLSLGIIPYLPKYTYIDVYGDKKYDMNSIKNINNRSFDETNIDKIAKTVDNKKNNILITGFRQDKILEGIDWNLELTEKYQDFLLRLYVYGVKSRRRN